MGNDKGRSIPQIMAGDGGCGNSGDDNGAESCQTEITENHLQCKHGAGNRGIEGCGDTGGGPASDQGPHTNGGNLQQLADTRSDGRTDLNDGPFPADGPSGSNGDCGSQGFHDDKSFTDKSVAEGNRLHDFRHAVTFCFTGAEIDQGTHDQTTQRWYCQPDIPGYIPYRSKKYSRRPICNRLDEVYEITKTDRTIAGGQPDEQGQNGHDGMLVGSQVSKNRKFT